MKKSKYILSFGLSVFIMISGCSEKEKVSSTSMSDEIIPVKVVSLNKIDVNDIINVSGQFTTDDETFLSFKTGGVVKNIYVKESNPIRKGQVLATLDLAEISARVNQAQIAFDKACRDYKRIENLYKDSVATLEQLQNAKAGLDISEQQLAEAKFNLTYSEIRAISDGVVLNKLANEGQIIGPGMPVLKTSSKGQEDWILRVAVSDKEWAQISINDKAKVNIEALNINDLMGYICSKAENSDMLTGSFSVDIKLNNTRKFNIASGMFGKAEIFTSIKKFGWEIPYDALLDGNGTHGYVFVTNNDKIALKVPVEVLSILNESVLISEGLSGYTSLIVSGSAYLTNNSSIKVIK